MVSYAYAHLLCVVKIKKKNKDFFFLNHEKKNEKTKTKD
jgi:hypothetical protein